VVTIVCCIVAVFGMFILYTYKRPPLILTISDSDRQIRAWNSAPQSGILSALMRVFDCFVALSEVEHGKGLRCTWLKYFTRRVDSS